MVPPKSVPMSMVPPKSSQPAVFLVSTRGPDTKQLLTTLSIQGINVSTLVGTGSSLNFIDKRIVDKLNTVVIPSETIVHLASSVSKRVLGRCELDFELLGIHYPVSTLYILPNLYEETILGLPFLSRHKSYNINLKKV
ncbi:hypothetical protein GJ496_008910 [Pomphorhynchus laevis]|nr:hypothetical protein GJ496_008910 [Pomphorhynchus laevis]